MNLKKHTAGELEQKFFLIFTLINVLPAINGLAIEQRR